MVAGNDIAKFSMVAVVAFGLGGCDSDTEAGLSGWEDAKPVQDFIQHDCSGSALEEHDERATFHPAFFSFDVRYEDAQFRCEQNVEGFFRDSGHALDILVQPVNMHPDSVVRCDCLYEITFTVRPFGGTRQVTLFRRGDAINEPNDPVGIASETIQGE